MKNNDEKWKHIEILSELKSNYDCFDENEEPYYKALSVGIKAIREQITHESDLDKIRTEIVDTLYVDSLIFEELIDFKNGKISADDVIEEFNRVTRSEILKILDKYKTEGKE